jgi:hypothetical protein
MLDDKLAHILVAGRIGPAHHPQKRHALRITPLDALRRPGGPGPGKIGDRRIIAVRQRMHLMIYDARHHVVNFRVGDAARIRLRGRGRGWRAGIVLRARGEAAAQHQQGREPCYCRKSLKPSGEYFHV